MKEKLQNLLEISLVIGFLVLCVLGLKALDNSEKENAIKRCGNINNIVENYTSQGDVYYTCKIEKK